MEIRLAPAGSAAQPRHLLARRSTRAAPEALRAARLAAAAAVQQDLTEPEGLATVVISAADRAAKAVTAPEE